MASILEKTHSGPDSAQHFHKIGHILALVHPITDLLELAFLREIRALFRAILIFSRKDEMGEAHFMANLAKGPRGPICQIAEHSCRGMGTCAAELHKCGSCRCRCRSGPLEGSLQAPEMGSRPFPVRGANEHTSAAMLHLCASERPWNEHTQVPKALVCASDVTRTCAAPLHKCSFLHGKSPQRDFPCGDGRTRSLVPPPLFGQRRRKGLRPFLLNVRW